MPDAGRSPHHPDRDGNAAAEEARSTTEPPDAVSSAGTAPDAVPSITRPRGGGLWYMLAGFLMGLLAGAGLLVALTPGVSLWPGDWLGARLWVLCLAAALPVAGVVTGLVLAHRR